MPTKYRGSAEEVRALDTYIVLARAFSTLNARVHEPLAEADLTIGQFGVLEALCFCGPMRQNELARKVLCSAGNLSIVLNNLERRELVRRAHDTRDGRCTVVHVTELGKGLIRRLFPEHARRMAAEFNVLSQAELEALREMCLRLARRESLVEGP